MKKLIKTIKHLIDLCYCEFNLDNYLSMLYKQFSNIRHFQTEKYKPVKLMSNNNIYSGVVTNNYNSKHKRNIYLIGKGILFDSGGLDLKRGMTDMTNDKAGMIIALGVADYFKKNVIAYCPVTTNFLQTSLITPGDRIKIGKKIVRVTNTDAEGRLILAEALSSLSITKSDVVITIATLTGCCTYAVDKGIGVLSPNNKLAQSFIKSANEEKEIAWQLPMFDYMQKDYNKKVIVNSNKNIKAGTSEAAMFLKQFVKYPENWLHLDIAFASFDKNEKANGVPVKSLINFIKKIK